MDLMAPSSWWVVIGVAALSVLIFSSPGIHTARILGFDAVDSACLGPALGYTYLLTAGVVGSLLGVAWTPVTGTLLFLATWAVGAVVIKRVLRIGGTPPAVITAPRSSLATLCLAVILAAGATATAVVVGVGSTEAVPQLGDTLFHLQAVQLLASTQDASFLAAGDAVWYSPLQYPGGFHVLAATLDSWTGLSTSAASHAALLAFCAVVWPLSVTFLVRTIMGKHVVWLLAGPLLAASIQYVPAYFLGTGGPLWSHLGSLSLLPVPIGCVALVVLGHRAPGSDVLVRALIAAAIAVCAVIACQPNGLYSLAIVGLAMSAPSVFRWRRAWLVAWVAGFAAAVLAWLTVRAAMLEIEYPVRSSWPEAVLQVVSGAPELGAASAAFAALALVGLVSCTRDLRLRGVALAWACCALLAIAVRLGDGFLRLTWPWWNDPSRIMALLGVMTVCVAAVGLGRLADLVSSSPGWRAHLRWLPALLVLPLVASAQVATAHTTAAGYRPPDPDDWWVTNTELRALGTLARHVPAGSVIAMSPYRGATFISLDGMRPVPVGPLYPITTATALVENELDQMTRSADVCAAVRSLGLTYAITGGDAVAGGADLDSHGIEAIAEDRAFPVVAVAGPYRLHELPACPTLAD